MRNLNQEAAVWHLFTSAEFFEAAGQECEETMAWFGNLAVARSVANFGRNNQIFEKFKSLARDFRRGSELARLGEYRLVWDISSCIGGDVRGMMEQPLHSWMTEAEYQEFSEVRINRLFSYAAQIRRALTNAMVGAESFLNPSPECPERSNDDDGFPGEEIIKAYSSELNRYKDPLFWKLPEPLPEMEIDRSVACFTGDVVPSTGVWYPSTGLDKHSLTFSIKGMRMQAAYRVIKTVDELRAEGIWFPQTETIAIAATWHPLVRRSTIPETKNELWAKAGEACPKSGIWHPTDPGATQQNYEKGEIMVQLDSVHGITVWRWVANR